MGEGGGGVEKGMVLSQQVGKLTGSQLLVGRKLSHSQWCPGTWAVVPFFHIKRDSFSEKHKQYPYFCILNVL